MKKTVFTFTILLSLVAFLATIQAGEVAIYTATTSWVGKTAADEQAQICADRLATAGVTTQLFFNAGDEDALATWMTNATNNGEMDVLVLYGNFPPQIYTNGNAQPDGSIAELFIESTDGDAIMNHGDWMFYVTTPCCNGGAGLQNMMDCPAADMGGGGNAMFVTDLGKEISPNLRDFSTDRPLHLNTLCGDWVVEAALAQSPDGLLADPVIIRDGDRGRIIPVFQRNNDSDPKGGIAAEIIAWLMNVTIDPLPANQIGLKADSAGTIIGRPVTLKISLVNDLNIPTAPESDLTINLTSDSATGAFDIDKNGSYDGTVTTVVVPAGELSVTFYYKETAETSATLSVSAPGLTGASVPVNSFEDLSGEPGEVMIYTGNTNWILKTDADPQAQICVNRLNLMGMTNTWLSAPADEAALAAWVTSATDNGKVDILVLYGEFPASIYPAGNAMPEGSVAELFIESTDGDVILYHADWVFYVCATGANNGPGGLQNMMDIPTIGMGGDNTSVVVTDEGKSIAPNLNDFLSDRSFAVDQLAGDWFVEAALAQDASGTRVDPCIVRDGNRGRIISMYNTNSQNDPKGAVAADVIAWLTGMELVPTQVGLAGPSTTVTGTQVKLTVSLQDETGSLAMSSSAVTVTLASDSATGAFDTDWAGDYDGTVTAVTIPAGETSAVVYYKDTTAAMATLSATGADLADGGMQINVMEDLADTAGEVMVYSGDTWWISKVDADAQAQICVDALNDLEITNTWYSDVANDADLAQWVTDATDNGEQDVLVLYGRLPQSIYPAGNTQPDGSLAELFIESTDGDVIINHGDYMFYSSSAGANNNGTDGLVNMMDVPGISMWDDNTPMAVTVEGAAIAPSLADFLSDRPFHTDELAGDWFVEAALGENSTGTRADPCIVRDGNRGRLVNVYQTADQNDPKGAVAAEIIDWLMGKVSGESAPMFIRGDTNSDNSINLADAINILGYLFSSGDDPACMDTADANDDGAINLADAIKILGYLFNGEGDLPAPFGACGVDPTPEDVLDCLSYTPCE